MKKNTNIGPDCGGFLIWHGSRIYDFANADNAKVSVNTTVGGPATGLTSATAGAYYYALFYSASATTVDGSAAAVVGAGNYAFNDPNWTFNNPRPDLWYYLSGPGYAASVTTAGRFNSLYVDPTNQCNISSIHITSAVCGCWLVSQHWHQHYPSCTMACCSGVQWLDWGNVG